MMLAAMLAFALPPALPCLGPKAERAAGLRQRRHGKGLRIGGIAFTAEDIASAKATREKYTDTPAVDISLTPSGQAKFARAQVCRLNRNISVWFDGALISRPMLIAPIRGPGLILQGSFTDQTARTFADRLVPLTPNTGP